MSESLTDIHTKLLKRAKSTKPTDSALTPTDYVHRIGDLEDPAEVVKVIRTRAQRANAFRLPHEDTWKQAFRAWMQILDPNKKEDVWRSKRFIPLLFQHIETAHPALAAAVFGGQRIWNVIGKTPEGRDHGDAMGDLIEWQARGRSRMKRGYIKALWWSLVTGTGLLDHGWMKEVSERMKAVLEDDFDGMGRPIGEDGKPLDINDPNTQAAPKQKIKVMRKQKVLVCDDPFVKSVNPFSAWLDPSGRCGSDLEWFFMVQETTIEKIVAAAEEEGSHLDKNAVKAWLAALDEAKIDFNFDSEEWDTGMDLNVFDDLLDEVGYVSKSAEADDEEGMHGGRRVVLLVMRSKAEVFTLAPGGRIIGWSDNPNAHGLTGLVVHHNYEIDDSPYGRGIGTVLLPHQELVNENINRAMDVSEISLMAPVGVDRSRISVLDEKFRWQPNALIRTRGDPSTAVKRLDMPTPTDEAMLWDAHLKKDADDTSGIAEQARGTMPAGVNTATAFSGLQANIKTRTFMHVERLNETLELSADLLIELNQQYMTKERVISIIGENGLEYRTIKPTQLTGDFIVHGQINSARMAPAMKVQQLISATQVIVPILQQVPSSPFLTRWVRMILKEMEVDDVDRLIPKNQEKLRDPFYENIALRKGIKLHPSPFDRHDLHIEAHGMEIQKLDQLIAAGEAEMSEKDALLTHMDEHMQMGQVAGAGMAGVSPQTAPPAAPPGGSPERVQAQGLGAAQGSNGIPGKSSPGPTGVAGRNGG